MTDAGRVGSFLALLVCVACGNQDVSAPISSETPLSAAAEPVAPTAPAEAAPPAAPQVAPVDLLHAVAVDVATSTALRRRSAEIHKLLDGDMTSAFNSESGDLVGAWIEVRLPADAVVTSIMMSAGHTGTSSSHDLFTANQRIARVRVRRSDGEELGVFPLDTASRQLQTLPVSTSGGSLRIEVVEVLAGSQPTWREACISELRVMGTAPEMHPGQRYPRVHLGSLPEPRPDPATTDREAFARRLRQRSFDLSTRWGEYEHAAIMAARGAPEDESDVLIPRLEQARERALDIAIEVVELADALAADRLRALRASRLSTENLAQWWTRRSAEMDVLAAGLASAASFSGDPEAPCRWARIHTGLLVARAAAYAEAHRQDVGGFEGPYREASFELMGMADSYDADARSTIRRLRRIREDVTPEAREPLSSFVTQADLTDALCWPAGE